MVPVQAHGSSKLHPIFWQWHLEQGYVAARYHLQNSWPVAMMGSVQHCRANVNNKLQARYRKTLLAYLYFW